MVVLAYGCPEDAEGAVALELVHPAVLGGHRPDDDVEEAVEHGDDVVGRLRLGERGRADEVDEEGADLPALAAEGDAPIQGLAGHLFAHVAPEEILEQRPGLLRQTPERALARLREYAALGIAHANIMFQPYGSEREQIAALAGIIAKLA